MIKKFCDKCGCEIVLEKSQSPPVTAFQLNNGQRVLAILRVEYKNPDTFPSMYADDARPFDMCTACHGEILRFLKDNPPPTEAADADNK